MSKFHELFGRQAEELTQLKEYFDATQRLLADVIDGKILPSELVVTQSGWSLNQGVSDGKEEGSAEAE